MIWPQLRSRFSAMRRWSRLGTAIAISIGIILLATHSSAYEVQINPPNPHLGDTISVIVQAENPQSTTPPTVTLGETEYPSYPIGGNRYQALLPTSPLDPPGEKLVRIFGQEDTRNFTVWLRNRDFPTQHINFSPGVAGIEGTDYEFDRVDAFKQLDTPERYWNGPLLRPSNGSVSSVYGVRRYYNGEFAEDYYHRGVDYAAGTGSPISAPAAGRVALVGRVEDGFELHGNTVGIDHGQGVLSIFIHMSRIDVQEGQMVNSGQVIGAVGSTGSSTGPHLHWGLYVHGVAVDPVPWRETGF
ncbi:MAG: M23 family metallopeptidase [Thainema sp.]